MREGTCWHGGSVDQREAIKVGRGSPSPPLGIERIGTRSRCVRWSANGRLGTAVPTCEGGAFEGTRGHGDTGTRARRCREGTCWQGDMGTRDTATQVRCPEAQWTRKRSSGLRSRQSAIRCGLSGSGTGAGTGAGPEPVPAPEYLNQTPDGRDPGPENEIPISGFPLNG